MKDRAIKHKKDLILIKKYLISKGVKCDKVIIWQSGFTHPGTKYGLRILVRILIDGKEERYAIPEHIVRNEKPLSYLKIEE